MLKILLALGLAVIVVGAVVFFLSQEEATIPIEQSYGPTPVLPPPNPTLIPTVNIATASSWPEGVMPTPAEGFSVSEFARGLDHPRMLHVLPNGDVLVAESNKPPKEDKGFSLRGFVMKLVMGAAGAEVPSANRISLLRDADGDGVAELKTAFLEGLNSPFGMALVGSTLYVANTDAIVAFPYVEGATEITAPGTKLADLPGGPINHHWTKDLVAGPDAASLYAGSGSNSNVGENGMAAEENRAAILKVDIATGATSLFASGLRNPNGLTFNPDSGQLWAVINERDEIGSDLVPDYMTSVQDGGFYGWPYSYFGQNVDERVEPQNPELVARAIVPDYALGTHTAPLGLAFSAGPLFAGEFANGAFVGQHGSWNRKPRSGYKVIFVPFVDGKPSGMPRDVLTNFVNAQDEAQGRPVGVAIDRNGGLLVADDVGNKVWRVTPTPADEAQ